jgi:hypothetical protein
VAANYTPAFSFLYCIATDARDRRRVRAFVPCGQRSFSFATQLIRTFRVDLKRNSAILRCNKKPLNQPKGGPMIGIAVAFLVSAVVLMTLSAIEG